MGALNEVQLRDFTGGLNLRRTQFGLGESESPEMMNVEIDPRGGFYTRAGWRRWNAVDATTPATWHPRNLYVHSLSDGGFVAYVTNGATVHAASSDGVFEDLSIAVSASPHLADFTSWGDVCYMACGYDSAAFKRDAENTAATLPDAASSFNDDYTIPGSGRFPKAEFVESHAGYMFTAYTYENAEAHPNRIRWSHPGEPEDWAALDFLDIKVGGGRITGLLSFQDHLLIFKEDSVWGLYGYNSESWQLIRVSRKSGAPCTTAITSSETAVYYFSSASRGAVFGYSGGTQPIDVSEKVRTAFEDAMDTDDIWLGWVNKRLWCSVPWIRDEVRTGDEQTVFVFDPSVGDGAWSTHRAAIGELTCIAGGSEVSTTYPLAAVCGHSGAAALVQLGSVTRAEDIILQTLEASPFTATYKTGWKDLNTDRRKSWRRPRFIATQQPESVDIRVDSFKDLNEAAPVRSHLLSVTAEGNTFWRLLGSAEEGGFDWGDGSEWGAATAEGSRILRASGATEGRSGLGVNRALQLQFSTDTSSAGKAWGVSAITLKCAYRRLTT